MKIKPLADRVVIKLVEEEEKIASYKGQQLPDDVLSQSAPAAMSMAKTLR